MADASQEVAPMAHPATWRMFDVVLKAIAPDDLTRHVPNCGYTDEHQECGCAEFGSRLRAAIAAEVGHQQRIMAERLAAVEAEALRLAAREMRNGLPGCDPHGRGIAAFEHSHADWLDARADEVDRRADRG